MRKIGREMMDRMTNLVHQLHLSECIQHEVWSLPPPWPHQLSPQRPVSTPPLPEGPRKPIEVKEDFSKAEAPASQVPVTTFYSSILRSTSGCVRYEKRASGGSSLMATQSLLMYVFLRLGRHYTEQWEEGDIAIHGSVPLSLHFSASQNAASTSHIGPSPSTALPKLDVLALMPDKGIGAVPERLVSALLPAVDQGTWKAVKNAKDAYEDNMTASESGSSVNALHKEKNIGRRLVRDAI